MSEEAKKSDCKCTQKDIEENKLLAMISYFWLLFLIPMFGKRDSAYAQFHAKQGLTLFVFSIIASIASMIPIIGWLLFSWIGGILVLVLFVIGLINSLSGKCEELPIIGKWFNNIKF